MGTNQLTSFLADLQRCELNSRVVMLRQSIEKINQALRETCKEAEEADRSLRAIQFLEMLLKLAYLNEEYSSVCQLVAGGCHKQEAALDKDQVQTVRNLKENLARREDRLKEAFECICHISNSYLL